MYDFIIVGGGFSGVISALILAEESNKKILLLEKNDRLLKKIPSTGNGRGNLTNESITEDNYHGDKTLAKQVLSRFSNESLYSFFEDLGVLCVKENGKVYPSSMQASSVSDMMRFKLEYLKVNCKLNYAVSSVEKNKNGYLINKELQCKNLIVCTGGASMKNFGTDGSFYNILKGLGIAVTQVTPSLVQLKTDTTYVKSLKGIKQTAKVTLVDNNKTIAQFIGDLLFTEYGVSGDVIFKISAYLSESKNPLLKIEFVPDVDYSTIKEFLINKANKPYILNKHLPIGVVQNKLGLTLLKACNLDPEDKADKFSAEKLAKVIKNFVLEVKGTLGFDYSQVTHGGVQTNQLLNNLKHKQENIYFAGEVLNIDGDCGGYNLQFAYSSARVVAESIINDN